MHAEMVRKRHPVDEVAPGHLAFPLSPAGGRFAAPESYPPKHLAERILTSKAACLRLAEG
jgi:hypothetical protein